MTIKNKRKGPVRNTLAGYFIARLIDLFAHKGTAARVILHARLPYRK
jgi:hypothetical protein